MNTGFDMPARIFCSATDAEMKHAAEDNRVHVIKKPCIFLYNALLLIAYITMPPILIQCHWLSLFSAGRSLSLGLTLRMLGSLKWQDKLLSLINTANKAHNNTTTTNQCTAMDIGTELATQYINWVPADFVDVMYCNYMKWTPPEQTYVRQAGFPGSTRNSDN